MQTERMKSSATTTIEPTLELANVTKNFGSFKAVDSAILQVMAGEFVVLVGPSGCGKSTLLRLIAGFERVTSGVIRILGNEVNDTDPRHRNIAMVFQSYALYPHMTVAENLAFPLKMHGMSKADTRDAVQKVGNMIGLDGLLERYPRDLSGGQRQRVAMGRAIVRRPSLFLFDEPLSNLDAALRVRMRIEIKELHRRVGNSAVYVTHDQVEAMTMADRIVVMRDGQIAQIGTPEQIYDTPDNTFVAQFIGSPAMNLIPARLERHDEKLFACTSDGGRLSVHVNHDTVDNREVQIGIRPEHTVIDQTQDGANKSVPAPGTLRFAVEVSEMLGRENLLYGQIADAPVCVATGQRVNVKPGETLLVRPAEDSVHLFDADTGKRLS